MPSISELAKRFKSIFNDNAWGATDRFSGSGQQSVRWIGGTNANWNQIKRDAWNNPAASACHNWAVRNFPLMQLEVYFVNSEGEEEIIADHPLVLFLRNPSDYLDYSGFLSALLLGWNFDGNAYFVRNKNGRGVTAELLWIPSAAVSVGRDADRNIFYKYTVNGKPVTVARRDMLHLKCGVDPSNPLKGRSPIDSAARDIYQIDQATNYASRIVRNGGTLGLVATPKEEDGRLPEDFADIFNSRMTSEDAGGVMCVDSAVELNWIGKTPQDLAMDTFSDRPESDIAANFGLAAQAIGLHVGRLNKTYANMKEAREISWEEYMIPTASAIASQLTAQLMPEFDSRDVHLRFATKDIRPLQPDLDALHRRAREDWQANLIDRASWKRIVGMVPTPEDEGIYFRDSQPQAPLNIADIYKREKANVKPDAPKENPNADARA